MVSTEAASQAASQPTHTQQHRRQRSEANRHSAFCGDHSHTVNGPTYGHAQGASLTISPASAMRPSSGQYAAAENGARRARRAGRGGTSTIARGRGGHDRSESLRGGPGAVHINGQIQGHGSQSGGNELAPRSTGMVGSDRKFGGQLTAAVETANSAARSSSLQPDAPVFFPGQPHGQREGHNRGGRAASFGPRSDNGTHRGRRASVKKSQALDIATRTHEDIANRVYECPICTNEIGPITRVWSCKTCWTVFHLSCIKKWSTNEGSTLAQQRHENGDLPPPRQWRCPGCNLPKDDLPSTYTCWCGKEADPKPISGIPPHSCGQTCGKPRVLPKKCPHPCELSCHAGPCPACTHIGPVQSCFCGKTSTSRKCTDTDYDSGWSCGAVCGDLMPCGEHTCSKPCHEGLCGACEVPMECRCYCGKTERIILCCERGDEEESILAGNNIDRPEVWTGAFDCGEHCQREFDCGKHRCPKKCHPQGRQLPHCPRSPDVVSRCPCGKTLLKDISAAPRISCEDPISNCDKLCSKKLRCGHSCQQVCHSGACMPCLLTVDIACRCGRTQSTTICHQGKIEPPQCMRPCRATLNCGRHECGERCCPGERKAAERQATKRKLKPLGAARIIDEGFEAEHICTRSCGRTLKCGNHSCPELCHKGPCGSCREAIFEEISCHCGKTVLQPPLPCGTQPPPCRFDCERPKLCGHPRVPHNCHGEDQKCPSCPFLIQKPCLCGKKTLKNQPCFLTDVRCGEVCGTKLKCGSHYCRKQCHRPGECEDAGKTCQQPCGKAKKACSHPCEEPCHAPSPCREDKPCQNKTLITCDCQRIKQEVKCSASKSGEGNSKRKLSCDDECARLLRNQKLAQALNIDLETHKDDHIPYSNGTLKMFRENIKWAQPQEREFRVFAADQNEKRLHFKPMPAHQRAFLHSLSEDFGLDSESMDPEPHRHVAVFKTPRFVMAPMKTLAECVRIRNAEALSTAAVEPQRRIRGSNEPFNGILLTQPRFGLTLEELRNDYASPLDSTPGLGYDISFLPNEEIVIKAHRVSTTTALPSSAIEASVKALKHQLAAITSSKRLAGSIQLCALDPSLNIMRREVDNAASSGGWSQVVAKGAAPRTIRPQSGFGQKNAYTVLGSKLKDARKKEEMKKTLEADVMDDWEEEVRREEEAAAAAAAVDRKEVVANGVANSTIVNHSMDLQQNLQEDVLKLSEEEYHAVGQQLLD